MAFDLRPSIYLARARVPSQVEQWQQGDRNAWNNCVPTSCMLGHAAFGEAVVQPQRATDAVYGPDYVGGEAFWAAEAWIQENVSDTPGHLYGGGQEGDLPGIASMLAGRRYVGGFFNCDPSATIVGYTTGLYHMSPIVYFDGDRRWVVLNVHDYTEVGFTSQDLNAAMAGAGGWVYYDEPLPSDPPPNPPPISKEADMIYVDVAPVRCRYFGAPTGETYYNVVPGEGDPTAAEQDGQAEVIAYDPSSGAVLGSTGPKPIKGNSPNVAGPNQLFGQLKELGVSGPCTVAVWNHGSTPISVTLHEPA